MATTAKERKAPGTSADPDKVVKDRYAFTLTENGAIDLDAMRSSSRERLLQAVQRTPGLLPTPPPSADTTPASAQLVPLCAMMVSTIGQIAANVAASRGYVNPQVLLFQEQQAREIGTLALAVLDKYGASLKYMEEITLAAALGGHFLIASQQLKKATPPLEPLERVA